MARIPQPPAGRWASLTVDAIGVYLKRSDMSAKDLYEAAGLSRFYWNTRMANRASFTLNDVDEMCAVLNVTPLDVASMAAKLGELAPAAEEVSGRG